MANARTATLHGNSMTAIRPGGRLTALTITTMGGYMAGGSGMYRKKVTTLVATREKVTTGSLKPIIR